MATRTAWRISSDNGWWSAFGKRRGKNGKKPGPPVHDNPCAVIDKHGATRHEFIADAVNELWIGDITGSSYFRWGWASPPPMRSIRSR